MTASIILPDDLPFATRLRLVQVQRQHVEAELWKAQLALYPDSIHVTRGEALQWMYEDSPEAMQMRVECWEEASQRMVGRRMSDRLAYYEKCMAEERWRMSRAVATAMSHDVGIFYQCGLMADGQYRDKGFRYGLEPGQYLSAFTHP